MSKFMGVAIALVVGASPIGAFADSKADWFKAVINIRSTMSAGVSYRDFSKFEADADTAFELAKLDGKLDKQTLADSQLLMMKIEFTNKVWSMSVNVATSGSPSEDGFFHKDSAVGQLMDAANGVINPGQELPTTALGGAPYYWRKKVLSIFFGGISEQADRVLQDLKRRPKSS